MAGHNEDRVFTSLSSAERATERVALVEPDDLDWDTFAARHPQGSLLQSSGWGRLKEQFSWQRRRLALVGPAGLLAGAQVLLRRRFGLAAAYVPRGPLFSGVPELDRLLLTALARLARRERAVFLRLEPNILEDDPAAGVLHSQLLVCDFAPADPLQPRSSIHLDLIPTPDRLLAGMSKGHRADIKRAAREGVTVRVGTAATDLDAFYSIMQATSARAQFEIHSRDYYAAMWRIFDQDALLLLAEHDGVPVATALPAGWGRAGLYLYSGSTEAGLKSGAQHAIQWHALQWARERGYGHYDFWGIPDALGQAAGAQAERERLEEAARADPLYGVYRFKKGFGGQVVRYLPAYDQVYLRPIYDLWRRRLGGY